MMAIKVLLVEDDRALREALADTLLLAGHDYRAVGSAEEALEAVEQETFSLVVSDVNMPGMDGHQLLGLLRVRQPQLPVLLMTAHGAVERAVDAMRQGAADYQRYQELVSEGAVPQQTFENYRTKYEVAQAALNQAKAGVSKANSALLQTDANQANEAAVAKKIAQAQAVLEQLEVSLDETEIKAPFDGVITAKYVEEGSMISQGTPIVAIQDPTDNWVDLKVPETELSRYALNQQVTLVGRDEKTKVTGTITDISKKAEFATQRATSERGDDSDIISFNVKIQVDSDLLRPGMRFRITNGERS